MYSWNMSINVNKDIETDHKRLEYSPKFFLWKLVWDMERWCLIDTAPCREEVYASSRTCCTKQLTRVSCDVVIVVHPHHRQYKWYSIGRFGYNSSNDFYNLNRSIRVHVSYMNHILQRKGNFTMGLRVSDTVYTTEIMYWIDATNT